MNVTYFWPGALTGAENYTPASVRLFGVTAILEEILEPCLGLRLAQLSRRRHSRFQGLLNTGRGHGRAAHGEIAALAKEIVGDELWLLGHLVGDKNHLRRVVGLVELEGTNEFGEHALSLVHSPILLVKELFLLSPAAIKDHHGSRCFALLLLVELVLAEGTDGRDSCSQAHHDHRGRVIGWEFEGTADHGTGHLVADGYPLNESRARTCFHITTSSCLPLVDDDGEIEDFRRVE